MSKGQRGFLIFAGALVFAVIFCVGLPLLVLPQNLGLGVALPVIQLPGEVLIGTEEEPVLTNTMVAVILTDIVVLGFAFLATRKMRDVPGRLQNLFEIIGEALYNLSKSVAGGRARQLFPLMATIFIMVLVANWMKLVPGVESVGVLHCAKEGQVGYPAQGALLDVREPLGGAGQVQTYEGYKACKGAHESHAEGAGAEAFAEASTEGEAHDSEAAGVNADLYVITPFVRAAATDLNFTLALAIIAMVAVQVFGWRSLGWGYFNKFFNFPALGNLGKKPMGAIDFIIGLLELISEFAKIISFAFRLFGVMFGGLVLLGVMTFLVAWILPVAFYGLELFIGAIQAFVFAMLFLVFASVAMAGHGEHEEGH